MDKLHFIKVETIRANEWNKIDGDREIETPKSVTHADIGGKRDN